jgi:hypothetical protein
MLRTSHSLDFLCNAAKVASANVALYLQDAVVEEAL